MVALLNMGDAGSDFHDDPIPLSNVTIRANLPLRVAKATALYAGKNLPVRRAAGGGVEVVVPRVHIHEVVCLSLRPSPNVRGQ